MAVALVGDYTNIVALTHKVLLGLAAIAAVAAATYVLAPTSPMPASLKTTPVIVGSTTIVAEVADTEASRELGLSGRQRLDGGKGMLFVFEQRGNWGIWMKDMQFPIDILFISETGEAGVGSVVSIEKEVSPDTYREVPPRIFYPPLAVRYILELPAGYAEAHGLATGTEIVVQ